MKTLNSSHAATHTLCFHARTGRESSASTTYLPWRCLLWVITDVCRTPARLDGHARPATAVGIQCRRSRRGRRLTFTAAIGLPISLRKPSVVWLDIASSDPQVLGDCDAAGRTHEFCEDPAIRTLAWRRSHSQPAFLVPPLAQLPV